MKKLLLSLFFLPTILSAQSFWTEDFGTGCNQGNPVTTYVHATNGSWTSSNTTTGTNDASANIWYVSATESGMGIGNCGDGCLGTGTNNRTLHVGNVSTSPAAFILCPTGDCGAAYDAGFLTNTVRTSKRAESPLIVCTGKNNITAGFSYMEEGDGTTDDFTFWYYDGVTWAQLSNPAKTNNSSCSPQGLWTSYTISLPASANNNANVKIGFEWVNNDDGIGSDPSVAIDDVYLSVPSSGLAPIAGFTVSSTAICVGDCINYTDTSKNTPSSWAWTFQGAGIASSTSQNPNNICYAAAGTYSVSLIAVNGIGSDTAKRVAYITVNPLPTITASTNTLVCRGQTTNLTAGGASTYTWTPVAGLSATNGNSVNATPSGNATYTVIGTAANGCRNFSSVTVSVSSPTVTSLGGPIICNGDSTTLTPTGALSYQWLPAHGLSVTGGSSVTVKPTTQTTYTVIGTDVGGCKDTILIPVAVDQIPVANAGNDDTICSGESVNITASGGTSFLWSNGASTASTSVSPVLHTIYSTTVSNGGCIDIDSVSIVVNNSPTASAGTAVSILQGTSITLSGSGGGSYLWSPSEGLSCVTCQNPIASPTGTTTYILIITDANGCTSSASILVTVDLDCHEFYIPTAFSPNEDGQNDMYYLLGNCVEQLSFTIYDRWGEKVFETSDISKGWDGTLKSKRLDSAVFSYSLVVSFVTGQEIKKAGNITLLR